MVKGAHPFFSLVVVLFWICCYLSFEHYDLNFLLQMQIVCVLNGAKCRVK